jgi:NitT/TauT family transport system substrate-binding protein
MSNTIPLAHRRQHAVFQILSILTLLLTGLPIFAADNGNARLRVQLKWIDQAQFAGFYVADRKGYFADEGLDVETLPGGPGVDPFEALDTGKADVLVALYSEAVRRAGDTDPVVNIGQVFEDSSLRLICRANSGIRTLSDVVGKTIATGDDGDRAVIRQMLATVAPGPNTARFMQERFSVAPLFDGHIDCVTGETYNEVLRIAREGHGADEFVLFKPSDYGVIDIEDGLYVRRSRLADAKFVDQLAHLIRGLKRGWEDARSQPTTALKITMAKNPTLDRDEQAGMIEVILGLLPNKDLLYFDPAQVDHQVAAMGSGAQQMPPAWTHVVWNRVLALEGKSETFRRATLYLTARITHSDVTTAIVLFGFCAFALAATIDAVSLGYDLWGRTVMAMVSVMGGGILRDLILARNRLPFQFLDDPTVPLAILSVVLFYSALVILWPDIGRHRLLRTIRLYREAFGFAVVCVYGATVCILAGTHWYWAPFGAAMTMAGGGLMRDVIANREPTNFRGAIFEEVGIVAGFLVIAGLLIVGPFEHSELAVYGVLFMSVALTMAIRLLIHKYNIHYPQWLAQPRRND